MIASVEGSMTVLVMEGNLDDSRSRRQTSISPEKQHSLGEANYIGGIQFSCEGIKHAEIPKYQHN